MRGRYYFRVKVITPYLFYSIYSIPAILSDCSIFYTISFSFTNYIVLYSPQRNHLKYTEYTTFVTALYFITIWDKVYTLYEIQIVN